MEAPIYLDHNGTTPLHPEVREEMRPFFENEFGNPSSSHYYGIAPKRAIDLARRRVADAIGCEPGEVVFTSGGTESNNHAIRGAAFALWEKGDHIITSEVEHPAVLQVCEFLQGNGFSVTRVPVDQRGLVNPVDLKAAITPSTILITIMSSNNEVGAIQPIEEISQIARNHGIITHTDAAQSVGKTRVKVGELGVDMLSIAGHKLYGPKGVGALYIRNGLEIEKFMCGADQERGRRAGTENVMAIVGLGKACEVASRDLDKNALHMRSLRDILYEGISENVDEVRLNGSLDKGLPNTLNLSFKGRSANRILEEIGLEVAASPGAACHSDDVKVSHVLQAMGVPTEWAMAALRFSTGRLNSSADIDRAVEVVSRAVRKTEA
jgi:cysteine desulfurase